ncbi:hypothetical protein NIES25_02370 [Nostoc linckia NIES-25]|nr:hypothetical protein NIES25_02370 [Nostoc linckia NIES-25]
MRHSLWGMIGDRTITHHVTLSYPGLAHLGHRSFSKVTLRTSYRKDLANKLFGVAEFEYEMKKLTLLNSYSLRLSLEKFSSRFALPKASPEAGAPTFRCASA